MMLHKVDICEKAQLARKASEGVEVKQMGICLEGLKIST